MSLKPRRVDFDATWKLLRETLEGVITCGSVQRVTWNDRFSDVYKLCTAVPEPHGDSLYTSTKEFLEDHVRNLHKDIVASGEDHMLEMYHKHWERFNTGAGYLNQLYGYLNNTYIKKQKYSEADMNYGVFPVDADCLLEIGELAKDTWKNLMIDPIKNKLVILILSEIAKDRNGYDVNQTVIHSVVTSFVDVSEYKKKLPLELYQEVFEIQFLKETGDYYRHEAARLKADCSCSEYLEKVIQRLDNENFRSRKFLHSTSYAKVTHEVQSRMVADIIDFLHGECKDMVVQERRKDLTNLYILLKPIHKGLEVLVREVEGHIKQQGMESVLSLKNDPSFVEAMLKVYYKFKELIADVFNNDQAFTGALDKACSAVINHKATNTRAPNRSPELLAKYCDSLLKKSTKGIGDAELDEKLNGSIIIFKYLDDKDVFQRFYSRMLAKRLIYSQSASMDAEESMITRLKQACGYEFTNKLHRMFTDVSVSADHVNNFTTYLRSKNESLGINFNILVFQAGAWPINQPNNITFNIPMELEKSVQLFEEFYSKKFSGRKLTWMQSLSNVELKLCYLKKSYIVTMSTFQMATLLPFESSDSLQFSDIRTSTGLPDRELCKQLQTLVDTKMLTTEDEKPVNETSVITLNLAYNNKRTKFKIMAAIQKETPQEVESTHAAVDEDRKLYLQAAIVRIMKARKTVKHNNLIQEVISQSRSRFTPSISMIKKSIETLIEKAYLERVFGTTDEYSYIA
ncbi:cullin-2 [Aplysia californica]|uniref:Cullin-2 n=1 Tax=Aplysia californica TaxID=6500 RepID=A0ABM0K5Y5_APLCA|nr:cullin-2 [Aplysia californica]